MSPAHRNQHPTRGPLYELEPYVMAGDIYGAAPYSGRGGWSWYTGSAAWLYRAALETLLGLTVRQGTIALSPCVPADWASFEITLRLNGRVVRVHWQRAGAVVASELKPHRVLVPGQTTTLGDLPDGAVLLVTTT